MQGNEIFTVKINSEMMSPTVKIGDTVNAVKVDEVVEDGLYVCINEVKGKNVLWIKRLFYDSSDDSFQAICDLFSIFMYSNQSILSDMDHICKPFQILYFSHGFKISCCQTFRCLMF